MSDQSCSNGPVSTLPGSTSIPLRPTDCDQHAGVPATVRVQGETDSMGCEYIFMCGACHEKFKLASAELVERFCDRCSTMSKTTRPFRDPDEGLSGPVYNFCAPCRSEARAYHADWRSDY